MPILVHRDIQLNCSDNVTQLEVETLVDLFLKHATVSFERSRVTVGRQFTSSWYSDALSLSSTGVLRCAHTEAVNYAFETTQCKEFYPSQISGLTHALQHREFITEPFTPLDNY